MALIIDVKVLPSSGKQKVILDKSGKLKFYLKSLPEKGLANAELIKIFAKKLSISQNDIDIIAGLQSRNKILKIKTNLNFEQLLSFFDIAVQTNLFGAK